MTAAVAAGAAILAPQGAGAAPQVIAPDAATLFAERAQRFRELASGHPLGDWLRFLGRVSRAQHLALHELPSMPLPDAAAVELARRHGMPPATRELRPPDAWREALSGIVAAIEEHAPPPARKSLALLGGMVTGQLDALAQRVLRPAFPARDGDLLPFVAAALQVAWTATAARLGGAGLLRPFDTAGICPCCGSLPVASVVRAAGEATNLRYLHCSLCNTEWNMARGTCTRCASNGAVSYRHIGDPDASGAPAVRAEVCDGCMSYLKILHRERAPRADAVADDLATLALDVLVDEAGYKRAGPNLLFVSG